MPKIPPRCQAFIFSPSRTAVDPSSSATEAGGPGGGGGGGRQGPPPPPCLTPPPSPPITPVPNQAPRLDAPSDWQRHEWWGRRKRGGRGLRRRRNGRCPPRCEAAPLACDVSCLWGPR